MMYQGGWFGMGWIGIVWIVVVVALAAAAFWGFGRGRRPRGTGDESSEEILKRRYARGEVDQAEFTRRLQDLRR